jgi:hypothetical protein
MDDIRLNMSPQELGARLASELFRLGDAQLPCCRIEFKLGQYGKEVAGGGFAEEPLARFLTKVIANLQEQSNG